MIQPPYAVPPAAAGIVSVLRAAGYQALFAGGCVRDSLLGIVPHDWDIATSAPPDAVQELFPMTVAVGKAFGVIMVVTGGAEYEVATFRTDGEYRDGRRPTSVCFSDPEQDAARRDFTVNAMFYDPVAEKIVDYVGGQADLERRVLRAVGDPRQRFAEDHLRLLRAVRFAARLGFALDPATAEAAREMASKIESVSAERVANEFGQMFCGNGAERALRMLSDLEMFSPWLAEVAALRGVEQPPEFHPEGDVFEHTALMFRIMEERRRAEEKIPAMRAFWADDGEFKRLALGWAVLLHDIGKPKKADEYGGRWHFNNHDVEGAKMAVDILEKLKQPTRLIAVVRDLVIRHMHFINIGKMREAKRRRFLQDPLFPLHLELHYLDCAGSHGLLDNYRYALAEWEKEQARPAPGPRLLGGRELIAMGYRPGALFREILTAVEDAALEGTLTDTASAIDWVRQNYPLPAGE